MGGGEETDRECLQQGDQCLCPEFDSIKDVQVSPMLEVWATRR